MSSHSAHENMEVDQSETPHTAKVAEGSKQEFSYNSIFGPGGFLSTVSSKVEKFTEKGKTECPAAAASAEPTNIISKKIKVEDHEVQKNNVGSDIPNQVPPENVALLLEKDHILEQILSLLDNPDLLNCRLVCHRYGSFAFAQLQKRIQLRFMDWTQTHEFGRPLDEFTDLLRQNQTHIQNQNQKLNKFPCTSFHIVKRPDFKLPQNCLIDNSIADFFEIYGSCIKYLELSFNYNWHTEELPLESHVIQQLQHMLVYQTPNLHTLAIEIQSRPDPKKPEARPSQSEEPKQNNCSPLKNIQRNTDVINGGKNTKLKLFIYNNYDNSGVGVLDAILAVSPNVNEIVLERDYLKYHKYLYEPTNRLHFLKRLRVDPYCSLANLEKIVWANERKEKINRGLQLKKIYVSLTRSITSGKWEREPEYQRRAISMFQKVLESSWNSLEYIQWGGVTFLGGFKWPQVMPRLSLLELVGPRDLRGRTLFLKGFNWSNTFPQLKHLLFRICNGNGDENLKDFLNFLNFEPVLSVKKVNVERWTGEPIPKEHLEPLYQLFPNAIVEVLLYRPSYTLGRY